MDAFDSYLAGYEEYVDLYLDLSSCRRRNISFWKLVVLMYILLVWLKLCVELY